MNNQNQVLAKTTTDFYALYQSFLIDLQFETMNSLREAGLLLHEDVYCIVSEYSIYIFIEKDGIEMFASDVTIYKGGLNNQDNSMNFGSSGAFNPKNVASTWRTIHAYSMLKNWDSVCCIVNTKFAQLKDFLDGLNKLRQEESK